MQIGQFCEKKKKWEHCGKKPGFEPLAQLRTYILDTQFSYLTILFLRLNEMVCKMQFLSHG